VADNDYDKIVLDKSTGKRWGKSGGKWVEIPATPGPGPVKRFLTSTAGVPENVDTSLSGNVEGAKSLGDIKTWLDALGQGVKGLNPYAGYFGAESAAEKRFSSPGGKAQGALEWLLSGVPYAGPSMVESAEKTSEGDIAGGTGSAIRAALLSRAAPSVARMALSNPVRRVGQFVAGAGPEAVERLRSKSAAAAEKATTEHTADVEKARGKFIEESGEKRAADVARSKAESGVAAKESVSQSKLSGPVYQRVSGMADAVGKDVQTLDQKVRQSYNGEWDKLRDAAKDTQVQWPEDVVAKAHASLQTPEAGAQFDRIMGQVREEAAVEDSHARALTKTELQLATVADRLMKQGKTGPEVVSFLQNQGLVPRQVSAIISSLPDLAKAARPEGDALSFGEARARYTKLGEKLYAGRDLPGDVHRALKQVQDAADKNIGNSLSSPALKSFYSDLKSRWSEYMSDFYDPNGAFTKVKASTTPTDRINLLTGKWGKEVMDAMARYRRFQPDIQSVNRLRSLNQQIEKLPSSVPKLAESPTYTRPEAPDISSFDPVMARRSIIEGHAPGSVTPGPFLMYALRRALLNKTLNILLIKAFLSGEPGGPLLPGGGI
jgi:hypothetical protein